MSGLQPIFRTFVQRNDGMSNVVIGVDLGGTRLRAASLSRELQIIERHETLTHAQEGPDATIERMKQMIAQVLPKDGSKVDGIGISAPGPANPITGVIVAPPNLPGWHNVPLVDILNKEFGVPVYLGNDANVAALAEVVRGAARGYRHAIYITVSTGIGGGVISDGRMLLGKEGLGAEAGHMIMVVENDHVSTLELEAAGPALARKAVARIKAGEKSLITELVNGDLSQVSGRVVGNAASAGDVLAVDVVRRGGWMVGLGIVTLLHLFNPEIVVLGGGVTNVGDLLFKPLREAVEKYALDASYWRDLKIVPSGLGEDVSIFGAAALVVTQGGQEDVQKVMAKLHTQ
jgi:glucokinase